MTTSPIQSLPEPSTTGSALASAVGHDDAARMALANRIFFRLYQCANMLHKTGTRAVEAEGLTTQQWAVLGALSRPDAVAGMTVNELARYLMVSRQNLSGVLRRLERDGHLSASPDPSDGRARLVTLTADGRQLWETRALPKIHAYYGQALAGFSVNDMAHTLHHLLAMLDNMIAIDSGAAAPASAAGPLTGPSRSER